MKKIAMTLSVLLAIAAIPLLAGAQGDAKTLTGEPIDIKCYLGGKSGEAHAGCAETCAKGGAPVGLLVDEGGKKQVYLLLGQGKDIKELVAGKMGKKVVATGKVTDKDGLKVLAATEIKEAGA
jgi:hypothetical protein